MRSVPFYVGDMNLLTRIVCSMGLRLALIPAIGVIVASVTQNGFAGLAAAAVTAVLVHLVVRIEDRRRRKRAKREHIAGFARW
jgi:hypothetical protein